jgi:hypothetical protein
MDGPRIDLHRLGLPPNADLACLGDPEEVTIPSRCMCTAPDYSTAVKLANSMPTPFPAKQLSFPDSDVLKGGEAVVRT